MIRVALILALCITLAACSSEKSTEATTGSAVSNLLKARLAKRKAPPASPTATTPQVTRKALSKISQPVILLGLSKRGATTLLVRSAQNNGADTYQGQLPISVTLTNGLVSATRGLGDDLLAQSLSLPYSQALQGPFPKTLLRTQKYISGENQLVSATYSCTLNADGTETLMLLERSYQTRRISEVCRNSERAFKNRYWVDTRSGQLWQSQQSVSQAIGHVVIQTLKAP